MLIVVAMVTILAGDGHDDVKIVLNTYNINPLIMLCDVT